MKFEAKYIWIGLLALGTVWVAHNIVRDIVFISGEPRPVTARGDLADYETQNIRIFEQSAPSVAYIFTQGPRAGPTGAGAGSGFVWDRSGHIVTNHHVVAGAAEVRVRLDSGSAIPARVIGAAPDYDLAVLKVMEPIGGLQPIPIGTSSDLQVGQAVLAIGNPFGLSRTLTTGIVSALDRRLPTDTGREIVGVIQTDAAINPGNSGGPLLDSAGRLIGVNTAIISGNGSFSGIGFAVPVDAVNRIVPQLIEDGKIARPGIGIRAASEEAISRLGIPGVPIIEVMPGGSAAEAGLRGVDRATSEIGDVITRVGNRPVSSIAELVTELDRVGIGNDAELTVLRDGYEITVHVTVMDIS